MIHVAIAMEEAIRMETINITREENRDGLEDAPLVVAENKTVGEAEAREGIHTTLVQTRIITINKITNIDPKFGVCWEKREML